ncbi:hypothetical protein Y032_0014g2208 [Ancylostoma ceylanicum]|uniref:Uncharacterized protein n=1 Tax=Ancylostoma ceylanicum TaxID=53326 RepID=A0A016VB01_9BILA|nr:hypothetical protein Y032_0014g2208 [Ancylostoma ceylanicum]
MSTGVTQCIEEPGFKELTPAAWWRRVLRLDRLQYFGAGDDITCKPADQRVTGVKEARSTDGRVDRAADSQTIVIMARLVRIPSMVEES